MLRFVQEEGCNRGCGMVICVGGGWMAHGASLRLACGLMRDVNKGLKMTYQNDNLDTEDIQRGGAQ